jgi:hypothetical protein
MQLAEVEAPGHHPLTAGSQLMKPPAGGGFNLSQIVQQARPERIQMDVGCKLLQIGVFL